MYRDSGSSLVMFLAGAAIGAVAVALYTPIDGPGLRKRLSKMGEAGVDAAEDALNQADEFVQDKVKRARNVVDSAAGAFQATRDEAARATE